MTPTELRARLYQVLDQVLETGEPVEIERKGRLLKIIPIISPSGGSKLARLVSRADYVQGDPDALVHVDWSDQWNP